MMQTAAWAMVVGGVIWFLVGVLITPKENKQDRLSSH
jgi:uncharacterized membrane protein YiaA